MAIDYTKWPLTVDVENRLAAAGFTLRVSGSAAADRISAVTDEVTGLVARETLRQFIADTVPTTRAYDGTGTAELDIDEFVTFVSATAIGLQADPGYPIANITAYYEQGKPQTRLVRAVGGLPAFQVAGVYSPIPAIFPVGRQNIQITANFGFGPSIPTDLWNCVCGEIALRLSAEAIYDPDGRVSQWKSGNDGETRKIEDADAAFTHDFAGTIRNYRKRNGRKLRQMRNSMI